MRQVLTWRTRTACAVCAAVLVSLLAGPAARAEVKTETVKYKVGDTEFVGFLALPQAGGGGEKHPGVLVSPEWMGLNDYARGRAKQLAEMGYVALALDPYGGGKNASGPQEAAAWAGALKKDRKELRARANAALDVLKKAPGVDPTKIAAIGYCFGGTTVLELARSGADVKGIVSFHGDLVTDMPAKEGELKAKVLACHGADDPFVPPEAVDGFRKEMQAAKADWQIVAYGNSVHGFTNPANAKSTMQGVAYNESADRRSWQAMKDFFGELFGATTAGAAGSPAGGR